MPSEMILPLGIRTGIARNRRRRRHRRRTCATAAKRRRRPAGRCVLLGDGQLRRGRNHLRVSDVDIPQTALRSSVHAGRRLDDRGLRTPQSPRRFCVQLPAPAPPPLRKHRRPLAIGGHRFRRGRNGGHGKRGQPQVGRSCRRCQRHRRLGLFCDQATIFGKGTS